MVNVTGSTSSKSSSVSNTHKPKAKGKKPNKGKKPATNNRKRTRSAKSNNTVTTKIAKSKPNNGSSNNLNKSIVNRVNLSLGGAQAKVASGKHKRTQTKVLLKVFKVKPGNQASVATALYNYHRELYFYKRLTESNQNTISLVQAGLMSKIVKRFNKQITIAYEYDPSFVDMFDAIHVKKFKFTYEQKIQIGKKLIDGLKMIHKRGVAHCDIKPENLLINPNGDVKFIDFGAACDNKDYPCNEFVGSLEYMNPSIFTWYRKNGSTRYMKVAQQADAWAMGLVLYDLFLGRLPWSVVEFQGNNSLTKKLIQEIMAYNPDTDPILAGLAQPAKANIVNLLKFGR